MEKVADLKRHLLVLDHESKKIEKEINNNAIDMRDFEPEDLTSEMKSEPLFMQIVCTIIKRGTTYLIPSLWKQFMIGKEESMVAGKIASIGDK